MTHFMFIVITIQFAFTLYVFSNGPSRSAFAQLIPQIVIFAIYFAVWILRNRIQSWIPYLYTTCLIFHSVTYVLGTPMAQAIKSPEEQELNSEAVLRSQMANCFRTTAILILSGCPSMMFLIIYLVIYMLAIASLSLIKGDLDDPIFVDFLKL